jgi:hypothetical protein
VVAQVFAYSDSPFYDDAYWPGTYLPHVAGKELFLKKNIKKTHGSPTLQGLPAFFPECTMHCCKISTTWTLHEEIRKSQFVPVP